MGTVLGESVHWPLDPELTQFSVTVSARDETPSRYAHLVYHPSATRLFGVDAELDTALVVDDQTGPREVRLQVTGPGGGLEPGPGGVLSWQGYTGSPEDGYGTGHLSPPGPPREGEVRIDWLHEHRFAGGFAYHYEDGGELRCAFDIPR